MKKLFTLACAIFLLFTTGTVSAVDTRAMEIPLPEKLQAIPQQTVKKWECLNNAEHNWPALWTTLQTTFIQHPMQHITQVCMYGSTAYILIEEDQANGDRLTRGALYRFGNHKSYVEKKGHRIMTYCELEDTGRAKNLRVNYLCYSPQVAAAYSQGEEWSFRIKKTKRRTYQRDCTVFFSSEEKKKCGKWKREK